MKAEMHHDDPRGPVTHLLVDDEGWADLKRRCLPEGPRVPGSPLMPFMGIPVYIDECPCTAAPPMEGASVTAP